jgi:hypothetical protein
MQVTHLLSHKSGFELQETAALSRELLDSSQHLQQMQRGQGMVLEKAVMF